MRAFWFGENVEMFHVERFWGRGRQTVFHESGDKCSTWNIFRFNTRQLNRCGKIATCAVQLFA